MTKATFHGKEYDNISFAPSYMAAGLITGAMDTDDRYTVNPDTKIAILSNSATAEVVGMFHALDVSAVVSHFEKLKGVEVLAGWSHTRGGAVVVSMVAGNRRVLFETICCAVPNSQARLIADVEEVTIQYFAKYDEEGGWEEASNEIHIGFKKSDPVGHFIDELQIGLRLV